MGEIVRIVIVKHPNWNPQYVFKVPEDMNLYAGDYVLCETRKSPHEIARCITPSFTIERDTLKELYGIALRELKPVVAWLRPVMYLQEKEGKDYDCENG